MENYFYRISLIVDSCSKHGAGSLSPVGSPAFETSQRNPAIATAKAYEQALDAALDEDEGFDQLDDDVAIFASEEHGLTSTTTLDVAANEDNQDLPEISAQPSFENSQKDEDDWEKQLEEELSMGTVDNKEMEDDFQIVGAEDVDDDLEKRLEEELNLSDD